MARFARYALAVCALLFGTALPAFAQMPEGTLTVTAEATPATVEAGGAGTIAVQFTIADGFHIYGNEHKYTPTKVAPAAADGVTFSAPVYPTAKIVEEWGEKVPEYFGKPVVRVPFRVAAKAKPGPRTLTLTLNYQVCNKEMCYDPVEGEPVTVTVTVVAPPAGPAANPAAPAGPAPADPAPPVQEEPAPPVPHLPELPGASNPEEAEVELLKVEPAKDRVALTLRVTEGWHFYSFDPSKVVGGMPSKIDVIGATLAGVPQEPKAKSGHGAEGYFEGTVTITLPLVYDKDAPMVVGTLQFQVCDPNACVDREVPISFEVPADAVTEGAAVPLPGANPKSGQTGPSDTPPASDTAGGEDDLRNKGLGAFLVACVLGGLFSLIMPCVYPLIPVTVTFFAKQAGDDGQGKTVGLAMAYGAGIVISFTGLGLLLTLLLGATGANDFAANPWVNLVIAGIFFYLTLALFGLVPLELPQSITARLQGGGPRKGFGGAFVLGLLFTVVTFTCVVPVAGSLMVIAAQDNSWVKATIGMLVYSTTMALPFMAFGLFPAVVRKLPMGGGWMHTVKVTGGFLELALVLYYFSKADYVWNGDDLWVSRSMALSVYAATGFFGGTYLLGLWRLPGDHAQETIGVPRMLTAFVFTGVGFLMVGGLAGRDVGALNVLLPPDTESHAAAVPGAAARTGTPVEFSEWEPGLAEAKKTGKPIFLEFTGGFT